MRRWRLILGLTSSIGLLSGCASCGGEDSPPDPPQSADMAAPDQYPSPAPEMDLPPEPEDMGPQVEPDEGSPPEEMGAPVALLGTTCVEGRAPAAAAAAPGRHELEGFAVEVGEDGRLVVEATAEPGRVIFASAQDAPLLEASRTILEAEEHQGSFKIETENLETCTQPTLERVLTPEGALVLQGGFADAPTGCQNLSFEVQLCPAPEQGHLRFEVTTSNPNFDFLIWRPASSPDEHIFGLGQQLPHDTLDLNGRAIPLLSQEGGVGRGHPVISPAVNAASPGSAGKESTSYAPAPHFITSQDRSLFLENSEYVIFDFREDDHDALRLFAPTMRGRIVHGRDPLELIERFTAWAGRQPEPPEWVDEGAIVALARPLDESLEIVDDLVAAGARLSAVWNQTWSGTSETFIGEQVLWNWTLNEAQHPMWDSWRATLEGQDIRVLCYVNSMFRDISQIEDLPPQRRNLFAEARDAGYLVGKPDAEGPYMLEVTAFEVGLLDLTNLEARAWMKQVMTEELLDRAGCSGWMADFAEALPFEAELASGQSAASYHNLYPVEWAALNREVVEEAGGLGELLVFNRSGWTRSPAHSLMLWQGDQLTTWDKYDGIRSALHGLLSGGFSGHALNHSDVGGYTSLSRFGLGYSREASLLERWTEMNAFSALLRTHEGNQPGANAQVYTDEEARAHFARMTKVYVALAPYRRDLYEQASQRGWPVVRHLMMHYPDDARALTTHDQFLLGDQILVAPTLSKCGNPLGCDHEREVYLPAGRWVHLWSQVSYGEEDRGVDVTVEAPPGSPAVFYERGSPAGAGLVSALRDGGILP